MNSLLPFFLLSARRHATALRKFSSTSKGKLCTHEGRNTCPVFGSREDGGALYCKDHKRNGDKDMVNKRCAHEGCDILPVFGSREDGGALYCKAHKRAINVDLKNVSNLCHHEGCSTRASFGSTSTDLPLFCKKHSEVGDGVLQDLRCKHPVCDDPRSFGSMTLVLQRAQAGWRYEPVLSPTADAGRAGWQLASSRAFKVAAGSSIRPLCMLGMLDMRQGDITRDHSGLVGAQWLWGSFQQTAR